MITDFRENHLALYLKTEECLHPQNPPGCLWWQTLCWSWRFLINLLFHTFVESCHCSFNIQRLCQVSVSKYLSSEFQRFPAPRNTRGKGHILGLCHLLTVRPDEWLPTGQERRGGTCSEKTSQAILDFMCITWNSQPINRLILKLPAHLLLTAKNTFHWLRHMCYMPSGLYTCGPAWQEGHRIFRIPQSVFIRHLCHVFLHLSVFLIPERKIMMARS